jgi:hypothetical protein
MHQRGNIKPASRVPHLEDLDPFSPMFPGSCRDAACPIWDSLVKEFDPLTSSPMKARGRLQEIAPTNGLVSVRKGRFLIRRMKVTPQEPQDAPDQQISPSTSAIRDDMMSLIF